MKKICILLLFAIVGFGDTADCQTESDVILQAKITHSLDSLHQLRKGEISSFDRSYYFCVVYQFNQNESLANFQIIEDRSDGIMPIPIRNYLNSLFKLLLANESISDLPLNRKMILPISLINERQKMFDRNMDIQNQFLLLMETIRRMKGYKSTTLQTVDLHF